MNPVNEFHRNWQRDSKYTCVCTPLPMSYWEEEKTKEEEEENQVGTLFIFLLSNLGGFEKKIDVQLTSL